MSWHTTAILINADYSKDYSALLDTIGLEGAEPAGEVSFEDASSSDNDGVAVGTAKGWTALWGNIALLMVDDDALAEIAKKSDIFWMVLEGASGTYGFTWYAKGKKVREWMSQAGEIIRDSGKRLAEEKKAFAEEPDEEQAILRLMNDLTLPFKTLEAIKYRQFDLEGF